MRAGPFFEVEGLHSLEEISGGVRGGAGAGRFFPGGLRGRCGMVSSLDCRLPGDGSVCCRERLVFFAGGFGAAELLGGLLTSRSRIRRRSENRGLKPTILRP